MIALEVEDMDRAAEYLKTKGVDIVWGPRVAPTYARAEIRDPNGYSDRTAPVVPLADSPSSTRSRSGCGDFLADTEKPLSVFGPKVVLIATSAASRPRAISTRPMRGMLLRASKVCQRPPR